MSLVSRQQQRGLTLISMLIVAVFLGCALLIALQAVPAYTEYFAVKRIVGKLADESDSNTADTDIRRGFERRAEVEQSVKTVAPTDLVISKRSGRTEITVEWERKVSLVGNASLLFEFKVNSSQK
ncbi:MAG: DUF4845 domain-containing protein [Azoarcus sp.]|nr:DUF4845 domain-containing protein [Azoarcus sp.]